MEDRPSLLMNMDDRYIFEQFHFHWGKTDAEGSEHVLDGKRRGPILIQYK